MMNEIKPLFDRVIKGDNYIAEELKDGIESNKDDRYKIPKGEPKASDELVDRTIEETEIYRRAKELILKAQRKQVAYGLDKYTTPLSADVWDILETIDHILDESIDKTHYLVMLRIHLERIAERQMEDFKQAYSEHLGAMTYQHKPELFADGKKVSMVDADTDDDTVRYCENVKGEKKMRVDVMVDLETLGTHADSTIIQISAIAFDINTGAHHYVFNKIADISKNEDYEMNVDGSTLKWWLTTNKELLARSIEKGEMSSSELVEDFGNWLSVVKSMGDLYLWGNGILFDNKMIQYQLGEDLYPIEYKNDRDLRTLVDLACAKLGITEKELKNKYYDQSLEPHDAFNDVINQVNLAVNCYKELTKKE